MLILHKTRYLDFKLTEMWRALIKYQFLATLLAEQTGTKRSPRNVYCDRIELSRKAFCNQMKDRTHFTARFEFFVTHLKNMLSFTVFTVLSTTSFRFSNFRNAQISGSGTPVVFSTGLFGIMPPSGYKMLLDKFKKISVIYIQDLRPLTNSDFKSIASALSVEKVGLISHSSFLPNTLSCDAISAAILCDPITFPSISQRGIESQNITTTFPVKIIQARHRYSKGAHFFASATPILFGDVFFEIYENVGHLDILDEFLADAIYSIGWWEKSSTPVQQHNVIKNKNKTTRFVLKERRAIRDEYKKHIVASSESFFV